MTPVIKWAVACTVAVVMVSCVSALSPPTSTLRMQLGGMQGLSLTTLAQASPELAFTKFVELFGRQYADDKEEYAKRQGVFVENVRTIATHNAGQSSFQMAVNQFADMTPEEFRATHTGMRPDKPGTLRDRQPGPFQYAGAENLPETVDWVKRGVVTPPKNQGACGSCWAFSTTGSVEGVNALRTGELVSLSEQELVDCDTSKDMGCGGGMMDFAFQFILDNGGIDTEKDYAYWGMGLPCNAHRENRTVVTIDGFEDVPTSDEGALRKAVAHQPVSVAICASSNLQFYGSGILDTCCTDLDHGVLAVGYGTEGGVPYWLVKNSWGGAWGEAGYFRLQRDVADKQGMCAIAKMASYPIKTHNNPRVVNDVCGWLGWSECDGGSMCECRLPFLFNLFCLSWGCSAPVASVQTA